MSHPTNPFIDHHVPAAPPAPPGVPVEPWEVWFKTVKNHVEKEEQRWDDLEKRLDHIDKSLNRWGGGLAVGVFTIPVIISIIAAFLRP